MDVISTLTLLGVGFGLGLKHAIEADHLAAVSTIVTQRRSVWSASLVGGMWGVGHTLSLLAAGSIVLIFHFEISKKTEQTLEFCVALMLITLGIDAIRRLIKGGQLHMHSHRHGEVVHFHPHTHEPQTTPEFRQTSGHSHHLSGIGARPLVIGMVHGLAGSGALMLLVLATISSPVVGLIYILIFGAGSIGGMMLMSLLVGLPLHFTARRSQMASLSLRLAAALFSVALGTWLAAEYISRRS